MTRWLHCLCWSLCVLVNLGQLSLAASSLQYGPVAGKVSSPFGWRTDPITKKTRFHSGLDIAAKTGTPVYAPQAGEVVFSGRYGGYGQVVVLKHPYSQKQDVYTLFAHNSKRLVRVGQRVKAGDPIAEVGSTGRSTGPHLHFEVHLADGYVNPRDYLLYLQQEFHHAGLIALAQPLSTPVPHPPAIEEKKPKQSMMELINGSQRKQVAVESTPVKRKTTRGNRRSRTRLKDRTTAWFKDHLLKRPG